MVDNDWLIYIIGIGWFNINNFSMGGMCFKICVYFWNKIVIIYSSKYIIKCFIFFFSLI